MADFQGSLFDDVTDSQTSTSAVADASVGARSEISGPAGLHYLPDFIAGEVAESQLLERIDVKHASDWSTELSRRVQHYGLKYDYTSRTVDRRENVVALPDWLRDLAHQIENTICIGHSFLVDAESADLRFEQVIINEYEPGQGIAPHIDRDCFGPVVATVSLGADTVMTFKRRDTKEIFNQLLERRSLLILSGESRSIWHHGIAKRLSDNWHGRKILRERRISLTLRTIA